MKLKRVFKNIGRRDEMANEQIYYVSLADKIISKDAINDEAMLEIVATPEDVEKVKTYMEKNNDQSLDERQKNLKTLFQLIYSLGTEETRKSLTNMIK